MWDVPQHFVMERVTFLLHILRLRYSFIISELGYAERDGSVKIFSSFKQCGLNWPTAACFQSLFGHSHLYACSLFAQSKAAFLKLFSSGDHFHQSECSTDHFHQSECSTDHFHLSECSTDHPTLGVIKLIRPALNSVRNMFFATENPSFVAESRVGRVVNFIKCQSGERKFQDACCM